MTKKYRKIAKYTKSSQKFMLEKQRRREIVALLKASHTQSQIAAKLGVSSRTVGRDVKRLRPYLSRLEWEEKRRIDEKITAVLNEHLAQVPSAMRFSLVASMWRADKNIQWKFFEALLAGDLPRLKSLYAKMNIE